MKSWARSDRIQQQVASFAALVFPILFCSSVVFGTWTPLLQVPLRRAGHSAFFFNELVGIIGTTGDAGFYKTTDGGKSWVNYPLANGYNGDITSIFMSDSLNGWSTVEEEITPQSKFRLFRTTDGGKTWTGVGPFGTASCVYQTNRAISVTSRTPGFAGEVSTNGGATFTGGGLAEQNGLDFVDGLHGVASGYSGDWLTTSDGGQSWQPITPQMTLESWGVYGVKGTPIFYSAGEGAVARPCNSYRSTDFGQTWTITAALPFRTTGHIAGVGEVVYIQSESPPTVSLDTGLYRTTDNGLSWQSVGGPSCSRDVRFAVTGCNGGIVYAFDDKGQIWKTRDGGDGSIYEPPLMPTLSPQTLTLSSPICSSASAAIVFKNLYCANDSLLSVTFLDSSQTIVSNGSLRFANLPALPKNYGTGEGDSLNLLWDPGKAYHHDTSIVVLIHLRIFSQILNQIIDTVVTVNAHAYGVAPSIAMLPAAFSIDTLHPCVPVDTLLTILNQGCDTLFITGASAASFPGFTLLDSLGASLKLPSAIPPGGTERFRVRLLPTAAGNYSSLIMLRMMHQGFQKDTSIAVTAFVPFENAFTFSPGVNLDTIATCQQFDTLLTIKNTSCDTIDVASLGVLMGTVFTLPGIGSFPRLIPPDSSWSFILQFSPTASLHYVDSVIVHLVALETNLRLSIPVTGTGRNIPSAFVTSLDSGGINFGSLTRCAAPDSVAIVIANPGCLPVNIISAQLEGSLAPAITVRFAPSVPISEVAGDTLRLIVRIDPSTLGNYTGDVHLKYQITGQPVQDTFISISATIIHGERILSLDTTPRNFGSMLFCETRDTQIIYQNLGCDKVNVTTRSVTGGSGFILMNPKPLPLTLLASQRDTLQVHFVPISAGIATARFNLMSDADSNANPSIGLQATVIPTDTLSFSVSAADTVRAGDTTIVELYSNHSGISRGLVSLHFVLSYNGDLLTPLLPPDGYTNHIANSNVVIFGPPLRSAFKTEYLPITIVTGGTELSIDSSKPFLGVAFVATISDSSSTTIDFSNLQLNGGDPNYSRCSLGATGANGSFRLKFICGDSTLTDFLRYGTSLSLSASPVFPDPMASTGGEHLLVPYHTDLQGSISVWIFNSRGEEVYHASQENVTIGDHSFDLAPARLVGGSYYYRLALSGSGTGVSGKFVVTQ